MKYQIAIALFLLPVLLVAQNVGIGTTVPNTRLHITGGSSATLSPGTGYFLLGNTTGTNLVFDNFLIQSRNNGAASSLQLNSYGGHVLLPGGALNNNSLGIGTVNPNTSLHVSYGTAATLSSGSGYILIGDVITPNLIIDNKGLQARNNGTADDLELNFSGGHILLGLTGTGNVGIRTTNPDERITIASGNIKLNNSDKGIILNNADRPFITRGFDPFTSGTYSGIGRWGMFMEPSRLTFGIPNIIGRAFEFSTYETNSTATPVLTIDRIGQVKRPATNNIDLLPVAFGNVYENGDIAGGTGNFTVTKVATGTYHITITGHPYAFFDYIVHVSVINLQPEFGPLTANIKPEAGGKIGVYLSYISGSTFQLVDEPFYFIVHNAD